MLLLSELVSNAVRHGDAASVSVAFGISAERVHVEVTDHGDGFGRIPPTPDPTVTGGWGLYLVEEMASRWGISDGPGTRVWFEIDR